MIKIYKYLNANPKDGMISLNNLNECHLTGKVDGKPNYIAKQDLLR